MERAVFSALAGGRGGVQSGRFTAAAMDHANPSHHRSTAARKFGSYELRQLLGKSVATMAWLAFDTASAREFMLVLPRQQPTHAAGLQSWLAGVKRAARLNHPHLAPVADVGVQDQWPFVVIDRRHGVTLGEWLTARPTSPPAEMVNVMIPALQGLAYAHDAGMGHDDVQLHSLLVDDQGVARWMALGVAVPASLAPQARPAQGASRPDPAHLQQVQHQRDRAERDLLGCGMLMHRWLTGAPALDEPDFNLAIARLVPSGHEILRLPWSTPQAIPDALRAIVNRCTANQERQRYRSARTLLRALEGWRQAQALESGGPLALLMDRLQRVGHLPAQPGLAARVAAITGAQGQHAEEMAEQVLQDIALSLELVRSANAASVRGAMVSGDGPVLAIRRCIALLGVDGVRRAANTLRMWPGPLQAEHTAAMQRLFTRVRLAGYAAQALRPAGYDPEVVFLVVLLQNLGRLLVQYHFPDEAEQIAQLMQSSQGPAVAGAAPTELPGLSEEAAANAVLGVDFDALRGAVVRQWGLGEEVVQMIRPLPTDKAVRLPDSDAEILRATASAATELAEISGIEPVQLAAAALSQVAARYSRALRVSVRDLRETLQNANWAVQGGGAVAATSRGADGAQADGADVAAAPQPRAGAAGTPAPVRA
jgi:eukaryotic-like serine/threonine-protein kinase